MELGIWVVVWVVVIVVAVLAALIGLTYGGCSPLEWCYKWRCCAIFDCGRCGCLTAQAVRVEEVDEESVVGRELRLRPMSREGMLGWGEGGDMAMRERQ